MENKLPSSLLEKTPWIGAQDSIWLQSQFCMRRNVIGYPFSGKCDARTKAQLEDVLVPLLLKLPNFANGQKFIVKDLLPLDRELLHEQKLYPIGAKESEESIFLIGEGASAFLHAGDHLSLQFHNANVEEISHKVHEIEEILIQILPFAFLPRFGYLTANPSFAGTGLTITSFLHLPALIHTKFEFPKDLLLTGLSGESESFPGDILVVKNRYHMGYSEEEICKEIFTTCVNLRAKEQLLRENLTKEQETLLKDLVSRSVGLVKHSFELQIEETLEALSHIKLGLSQGWISGIEERCVNDLLMRCQKAHLQLSLPEAISQEELTQKRASYLHEKMKDVQSTI